MKTRQISINKVSVGSKRLALIAGPCVIENESLCFEIGETAKKICDKQGIGYIFKASYDKANRSSIKSFRGPGLKKGLKILKKIKEELGVPVTTDVHTIEQVKPTAKIVDLIQIPAFLCRQTDLILEAAKTTKPVNVKKGQFLSPKEMLNAIKKIESAGNKKILLTERGTFFGYNSLVVDMRAIPTMNAFGYPTIFDATNSIMQPRALETKSSCQREFIQPLALAAIAAGAKGLFIETHPTPEKALSDAGNMLELKKLEELLKKAKQLYALTNNT